MTSLRCGSLRLIQWTALLALVGAGNLSAHAFLQRAEPPVGGTVQQAPGEIRALFTEGLEVKASSFKVFNTAGSEVDKKDVHTDPKEPRWLIVSLPASVVPGTYKVVWRVVAQDGHETQGSYTFQITPG